HRRQEVQEAVDQRWRDDLFAQELDCIGHRLEQAEWSDPVRPPAILQACDESALRPDSQDYEDSYQAQRGRRPNSGVDDGHQPRRDADADQPVMDRLTDGQPEVSLRVPLGEGHRSTSPMTMSKLPRMTTASA